MKVYDGHMSVKPVLRALVLLCAVLNHGTFANKVVLSRSIYFDKNKLTLMPAYDKPVTTLSDLNDGVYSIQLLRERSSCGSTVGPGMTRACA